MGQMIGGGLTWDGGRTRRIAVLLIALCVAVLLIAAMAPAAHAADSADSLATSTFESTIVAKGVDNPIAPYPWNLSGTSSMRGVSWS